MNELPRVARAPVGRVAWLALAAALVGCADFEDELVDREAIDVADSEIINGTPDTTHQAVVALFSQQSGCTGTIIHTNPPAAWILTAAHCFGNGAIQVAVIGNDYNDPNQVMSVVDYQIHPQYNPNSQNLEFDFAILRTSGASSSTPVIAAMTPAEDNLVSGTPVEHVGYGLLSSSPEISTSVRHHAFGNLNQVASVQISYAQPNSGPCSGDSGGPNLADAGGGQRVAGVVSFGDQECEQIGVSGRASSVYNSFIVPFIGEDPTGSSVTTTTAGAGGAGSGVGGADASSGVGASDGSWITPGTKEDKYGGATLVTSGSCSAAPAPRGGALGWLVVLVGLGLVVGRSRSRRRSMH
jgi:secreted trypsin-like serine protease